jgi:polysaccharide chain length determinant protein (PEP-CTERM system associated)
MTSFTDEIRLALHSIWMRRWLALAVAWAICLLGWLVISMIPNRYESKARIFVQLDSLLPDSVGMKTADRQQGIDRVRETLTSTISLKKVVLGTDLKNQVSSDQDVLDQAEGLRPAIKVIEQQDNLFEISATSSRSGLSNAANAKLSTDIVQKLINLFEEENIAGGRNETGESLRFLDRQIGEREKTLQAAEDKRAQFEQKYMGLLPGSGSIEQRMAAARQELSQVSSQLVAAQSGLAALNGQMASTPATVTTPGSSYYVPGSAGVGGGAAHALVAQLQGQIAAGHARGWTDNYPDMQALNAQLASARADAAREPSGGGTAGGMHASPGVSTSNPMYVTLRSMQAEKQAAAAAAGARKAQLESELAQITASQTAEPGVAAEQARLNRDYDVQKAAYDKLLASREEIRLRNQVQTTTNAVKFRVIDPPAYPRSPAAPNRPLLLVGVLLAGVLGGLGAAFGRSKLQTTYATLGHLSKASGLPVIGSVGRVLTMRDRETEQKHLKWFQVGVGALGGVFMLLLLIEFIERSMVA